MSAVIIVLAVLAAIVVLFLVAWLVVGLVLKLLWWAIIGVVIGAIARAILPGKQTIGLLATAGAGIGAAFLGGVIGHVVGVGSFAQFLIAVVAAIVIVAIVSASETVRA
jgi:uncharacterized membrane protein YeaQ/YmgE (transglycosylase-associated protein family)